VPRQNHPVVTVDRAARLAARGAKAPAAAAAPAPEAAPAPAPAAAPAAKHAGDSGGSRGQAGEGRGGVGAGVPVLSFDGHHGADGTHLNLHQRNAIMEGAAGGYKYLSPQQRWVVPPPHPWSHHFHPTLPHPAARSAPLRSEAPRDGAEGGRAAADAGARWRGV
jgi:hypothetical protein